MKKLLVAAAFVLAAFPAFAQETDAQTIAKVEAYLNGITTLQSKFIQANSDGSIDSGTFYLKRPGKLRFQYDPPKGDYIVADGLLIHYWDDGVKNYSNAPIGSTLADFLLQKKIKLSGDLKVTSVRRPVDNKLVLTIIQRKAPEAGDLRLLLTENPMRLEKWRITDPTGNITEVTLNNVKTGGNLNATLFRFVPPKGYDKTLNTGSR